MNRAFVKDPDETSQPEQLAERPQSPHPNYVTPHGLQLLQEEATILTTRRDALLGEGRLADPLELATVQRDLRYVEGRLQRALLVVPDGQPVARVRFGCTVEVCDEAGQVASYTLVGEDEADPAQGKLSWVSPLAEVLLHAEVGDEVMWRRPAGTQRLEILAIRPGAPD